MLDGLYVDERVQLGPYILPLNSLMIIASVFRGFCQLRSSALYHTEEILGAFGVMDVEL
jgi:hypothetical protein